jgi:hypothetical protein
MKGAGLAEVLAASALVVPAEANDRTSDRH